MIFTGLPAQDFGLGTDFPNTQSIMEIVSSNKGVLIPRMTIFERGFIAALDGTDEGLLIYNTTTSDFNYWDGSQWLAFPVSADNDWSGNGTGTMYPTTLTDDVAIGSTNNFGTLSIERTYSASDISISSRILGSSAGTYSGLSNVLNNTNATTKIGINNNIGGSSTASASGVVNAISDNGNGDKYGINTGITGSGSGSQYGLYNMLSNTGTGIKYGIENVIGGTTNSARTGMDNQISGTNNNSSKGIRNLFTVSGSGTQYGVHNQFSSTSSGTVYGTRTELSTSGNGSHFGYYANASGTGTGNKYGLQAIMATAGGGTQYGIHSQALKAGSYSGFFLGDVYVGTTALDGYKLPASDSPGLSDYVMTTDGAGQASWVDPSTLPISSYWTRNAGNLYPSTLTDNVGVGENSPAARLHVDGSTIPFRVDVSSTEAMRLNNRTLEFLNSGGSVFVGEGAGINDDLSSNNNTAVGYGALTTNMTGYNNTAVGSGAGSSISIGYFNVAIGTDALNSNISGVANVAVGESALESSLAGYNVAVGWLALTSNTTGNSNTAIGNGSMDSNISGNYNVGVGSGSLAGNTSGGYNVAVGVGTLWRNTTGEHNVGLGFQAGYNCVSGNRNVFIGYQAGGNETGSDKLYIDNSNTTSPLIYGDFSANRIGINTSLPAASLHVNGGRVEFTGSTDASSATGSGVLEIANTLRFDANEIITNANATLHLQYDNIGDLRIDNTTFMVDASTNSVGIGTITPVYRLQLSTNSAAKPTSALWTVPSDRRLKKDVRPFTDGLNLIRKINPIWFTYNGKGDMPEETGVGTVAQELEKIAPYMVSNWEHRDSLTNKTETYLAIDYGALDFVMVNAIQELNNIINSKEERIVSLESTLKTVLVRIEELEESIK